MREIRTQKARQQTVADVVVVDVDDTSLLLRLPPELLPTMVEASASPLHTYLQLLSLCRATRTAVRGTPPRELSFCDDEDSDIDRLIAQVTVPTPDALAALVGPCKGLVRLTLPVGDVLPLGRCHPEETARAPWVNEAFSGHGRLAVLRVPSAATFMPALPGIVGHLPGLAELHLGDPDRTTIMTRRVPPRVVRGHISEELLRSGFATLLATLGRSCPGLRVLHHTISGVPPPPEEGLASLQRLILDWYSVDFLRPLASRLTQLRLLRPDIHAGLADVGLCRLETLQLSLRANTNTLRTVILTAACDDAPEVEAAQVSALLGPLNGLPHLTDLTVIVKVDGRNLWAPSHEVVFGCLRPRLLDQLEHLAVHQHRTQKCYCHSRPSPAIRVASRSLRTLCFDVRNIDLNETTFELACPRLEQLAMPEHDKHDGSLGGLVLDCPQLRSIEGFPTLGCQHQATVMPHLARVRGILRNVGIRPPYLSRLLNMAPQLRDLSPVVDCGSELDLLRRLLASDVLTRLSLTVDADTLPDHDGAQPPCVGRTLRLPAQLERLEVHVWYTSNIELVVDGPGLRSLRLDATTYSYSSRLGLADPGGPVPPLVNLALVVQPDRPCGPDLVENSLMEDAAGSVELLGARLRRVCLKGTFSGWPQLAAALGRLPRLADLCLKMLTSEGDLVLACPVLKRLTLSCARFRSVVFDCPLLEIISEGICPEAVQRFEPVGGRVPPNLHLDVFVARRLAGRFPWLMQVPEVEPESRLCPTSPLTVRSIMFCLFQVFLNGDGFFITIYPQQRSVAFAGGKRGLTGKGEPAKSPQHQKPLATALNVAEKPSVAREIASALGGGTARQRPGVMRSPAVFEFRYTIQGRNYEMMVTAVAGHLMELDFPPQFRTFRSCEPIQLFDMPVEKTVSEDKQDIRQNLEREARNCSTLILWLDCDREGENIASEVVEVCRKVRPGIQVLRAHFSSVTARELTTAVQRLGRLKQEDVDAVDARQEIDLRIGAAFTRFLTLHLQHRYRGLDSMVSYGPCQFPTLGFVVDRYWKSVQFKPEDFFSITVTAAKESRIISVTSSTTAPCPSALAIVSLLYTTNHSQPLWLENIPVLTVVIPAVSFAPAALDTQDDAKATFSWDRGNLFDRTCCVILYELCCDNPQATVTRLVQREKRKWSRHTPAIPQTCHTWLTQTCHTDLPHLSHPTRSRHARLRFGSSPLCKRRPGDLNLNLTQ
ncbi:putative DNA topoisomerase 3 [Paratrimastix pyriformis]|uniref:DNA topoisomerase n=1 Tax=Paratrimastix pyriformis TaxID=342808 RepID=A0ABQ8UIV2_9EUKA|nr:putative DNA topoisomerase 3 [Paratrimastix pyriformis]